jgi:hypothetical protein
MSKKKQILLAVVAVGSVAWVFWGLPQRSEPSVVAPVAPVVEVETAVVEDPGIDLVREHVAKIFADPDAELTEVSAPVLWFKEEWRTATVRFINTQGGRVIENYLVRFKDGEVNAMKPEREVFVEWAELDPQDKTLNLKALAKAFDEAEKFDVRRKKAAR